MKTEEEIYRKLEPHILSFERAFPAQEEVSAKTAVPFAHAQVSGKPAPKAEAPPPAAPPASQLRRKEEPGFSVLVMGLTQERSELYRRIDERADMMIDGGLVEEVEQLLKRGYSHSLPSMSGIGYRQIGQFLRGEMTLPDAVDRMKYETHRLARHQYAWFRLNDSRIRWFDVTETKGRASIAALNEIRGLIEGFMS